MSVLALSVVTVTAILWPPGNPPKFGSPVSSASVAIQIAHQACGPSAALPSKLIAELKNGFWEVRTDDTRALIRMRADGRGHVVCVLSREDSKSN